MQEQSHYWLQVTAPTSPVPFTPGFSPAPPQNTSLDLAEYWNPIRRNLRLIATIFVLVECLTLLVLFSIMPLYSGFSTILIQRQIPDLLESKVHGEDSEPEFADTFYKTQYEMLKSRSLAARVIRDLALDRNPLFTGIRKEETILGYLSKWRGSLVASRAPEIASPAEEILGVAPKNIDLYLQQLTIRPHASTRLVSVAFSSPDPALAAEVTNAHIRAFIRSGYEQHARSDADAERFLEGKLDELESRIEKSEAALNKYRQERGILAFSLDDKDQMISARMAELNRDLVHAEAERIALEADVETIKSSKYDSLPAVVESRLIQQLREESSKLEGQYASLSNQFTPDYPPVAQLRAQLREVRQQEQGEIAKVVESIQAKYRSALERETELRSGFEQEKAHVMSLKDASLQDVILAREVDTNRTLYQSVLERIKILGLASESQVTNISVVDPAEMPIAPSSPKKKLTLVCSGFLALLIGIGIAYVREASDSGLKTADEAQSYLQLPTLATVLHISNPTVQGTPAKGLMLRGFNGTQGHDKVHALPLQGMFATAAEAYRAVRTGILLSRSERPPQTILFTSGAASEGKSLTAINSAIVFAQMLDRVLLIDADLRRPLCHDILGCDPHPGLTETLTGLVELKDAIQPTSVKGLFLLSAGLTPPNPSELLGSKKMREVLKTLASSFEYILIDSAPILPVSDPVVLSTLVDGVIVVANVKTPRTLVREGCARLTSVGAKLFGVVLNDVDPEQRSYAPYYRY